MSERTFGVVGLYESADRLLAAIPRVREKRLGRLEAYTPYPVHGLEQALGLRRSPLAGMVFVMALIGAVTALFFQWWMSAVDYPIPVGGKPLFSWEAFVPILFEVTVLFATFTAGLGMLFLLNRLPFFSHPVLHSKAISAITRDAFGLAIEAEGDGFDARAAGEALRASGATSVEVLEWPAPRLHTSREVMAALGAIVISCIVAGYLMYWGVKLFPVLPPMSHMEEQPRLDAFEPSAFFRDGHGMQHPAPGTVARGATPYLVASQDEAAVLGNPLPRTPEVLERGRAVWGNHCVVCHGPLADGATSLTAAYGAKPANLQGQVFRDYPDGMIYHVILKGKGSMPSYAADLDETERWAVIHYLRALQRARNAREEDLR